MRLFAGCGIVAGSDPEAELAESDAKFVPMRDALTAGGLNRQTRLRRRRLTGQAPGHVPSHPRPDRGRP